MQRRKLRPSHRRLLLISVALGLTHFPSGDKIRGMGEACGTYGGGENACIIVGWKPARKSPHRRPVQAWGGYY